ncbi:hypothetical protein [Aequorivita marina]|uniref:hypothetical protein n=1 Tax=Aequorivita marina TaxID=3073654 RepID=UPI0028770217|nr:hypothetical protein [Aequorivita sp. S2608]MDS1298144.1 hypothetical protein [Aequorivita sp. S2608]
MSLLVVSCSSDDGPGSPAGLAPPIELDCSLLEEDVTLVDNPDAPVDYIINCRGQVKGKLTIEPGVVIEFGSDAGLRFHGTSSIQAVGTADKRIIMRGTEPSPGWWQGLNFITTNNTGIMEYVDISHSGGQTYNGIGESSIIVYNRGALIMNNSSIRHSEGTAFTAIKGSKVTLENNTFTENVQPLIMTYTNADVISASNDFTGNEIDKVTIITNGGALGENHIWQNINVPYVIQGTLGIGTGGSITVEPGVEIEMASGSSIKVQEGGLKLVGTETMPIIIRGENPGAEYWENISIAGANAMNEIGYAKISGAGENPSSNKGAVYLYYSAKLNIHNTEFKDLASCGVYGKLLHSQSENPNYESSNLTFINTPCTELFERG